MTNDVIEGEVNLMESGKMKKKVDDNKKKIKEKTQPSSSQSSYDEKFDIMMKTMDNLMERIYVDNKPLVREH